MSSMNKPQREQSRERAKRYKADSIEAMGLEAHLNTKYAYLKDKFGMEPYQMYTEIISLPDAAIAEEFSTVERKINYHTAGNWRRAFARKPRRERTQ